MFTANCKHQILVENFTKQKMTSSKWPKAIVKNKTNMKLLIVMWGRNNEQKACKAGLPSCDTNSCLLFAANTALNLSFVRTPPLVSS